MDSRRFAEQATALLDRLGTRLSAVDQDWLRGYLSTGEDGLFADHLSGTLWEERTPIDAGEIAVLRELLAHFELRDGYEERYPSLWNREQVLASLNVSGERRHAG